MNKYWSEITKAIEPYIPGEQPRDKKYIKLNTNENPYPPSPLVMEAIKNAANESLRLYPDPTCNDLREAAAQYYNLTKEQIFAGNGSDELLAFSFQAFFNPGNTVLFPDISYSFYKVYAALYNIDYELVPLEEDFSIPVEPFLKKNGGIIFPNPNAPTAKLMPLDAVVKIIEHNTDSVVILDEAYIDFGGQSVINLINQYPNLLVIHTLSKSRSLAGLRIGLAFGHEDLIEGLDRIKNSFNSYTIDRLALAGAAAALKDEAYFEETTERIINTRKRISKELISLGFKVIPSTANFIFISHPLYSGENLFLSLREKGILVRYFKSKRIDNYIRVTIGTDEEMDIFIKVIKTLLGTQ